MIAHSMKPPRATEGPYRDLNAAVLYASARCDMAVLNSDASDALAWQYTLLTTRDEHVALTIHLPPDPDPSESVVPTEIVARVGSFGDPVREEKLVTEITDRLKALRKTGIAPGIDE